MRINNLEDELICTGSSDEVCQIWEQPDWVIEKPEVKGRVKLGKNKELLYTNLMQEFTSVVSLRWEDAARLEGLQKEIALLKIRCATLERQSPILVPIQTLAPEPYELIKPITVVVRFQEEHYIASFFDANISSSGDTHSEAIFNLKDMLISMFDMLEDMDDSQLGPEPLRQKQMLREFIRNG